MRVGQCSKAAIAAIIFCALAQIAAAATQTLRVATYNIDADINGLTMANFGTEEAIEGIGQQNYQGIERPVDILALQETTSNAITVDPIVADLNVFYGGTPMYAQSPVQGLSNGNFVASGNGPNAIIYNTQTVQLVDSVGVGTPLGSANGEYRQVMRYQFQPVGGTAANTFYVYVTHMKSSFSGSLFTNESLRNGEAQIIRQNAATLGPGASILYVGDFNLSGSAAVSNGTTSVSAYQTMTAAGIGQAVDPLNLPQDNNITWANNPAYASIMTESVTSLNYRDDLQLMTQNVLDGTAASGLKYVPGSLHTFGNNGSIGLGGLVFDDANTALNDLDPLGPFDPGALLFDMFFGSDHYPVVADYTIAVPEPVSWVMLGLGGMAVIRVSPSARRNVALSARRCAKPRIKISGVSLAPIVGQQLALRCDR